jgi:signal transduction histidine kinase
VLAFNDRGTLRLEVDDDGPGVGDTANLFVPFFTTKPGGSGIGLALAREIAEAHGGDVSLRSRPLSRGAEAVVRLPLSGRD